MDCREIFAPVINYGTLRFVLALVVQNRLKMLQVYFKSAFFNGNLQEVFYIAQTKGFVLEVQEGKVMRLHKALYGLRQAAWAWNQVMCRLVSGLRLVKNYLDELLYTRVTSIRTIVVPYVYDILIVGRELRIVDAQIGEYVDPRVDLSVTKFLGMCVD